MSILVVLSFSGCYVSQDDYNKLDANYKKLTSKHNEVVSENTKLAKELDECKYGEEKLIAKIEKATKEKNYSDALNLINELYEKHPESSKIIQYKKKSIVLNKKILKEKQRLAKKVEEEKRLANLNNTGIWKIRYYVDNFGEPTKTKYITNENDIHGTFSNTATQNSKLDVRLLIDNKNEISIKLYEYGNSLPVKGYSDIYDIYVKDRNGHEYVVKKKAKDFFTNKPYIQKYTLIAHNSSDRLVCTKESAIQIHKALLKGGNVEFYIKLSGQHSEYRFNVNAEYYNNAYRKLRGK